MSSARELTEGTSIQQFVLLAKASKGRAIVALIEQALNAPNLLVFGELLDAPNVKAIEGTEYAPYLELLKIFTYGTYSDYKVKQDKLPPLTPAMLSKIRQLTVVTLSAIHRLIPYTILLKELDLSNVRELEDLIIDCIYQGIIKGKLDQKQQHIEVDFAVGRDIVPERLDQMIDILANWVQRSDKLLKIIEDEIKFANTVHESARLEKADFEQKLEQVKTNVKVSSDAGDLQMQSGAPEFDSDYMEEARSRKSRSKVKGRDQRMRT
eukprot:TRINITY_DN5101_c0_g1_i1.p1 TRINITY_DN5101_c0_g1~~TRINITY_DN5101_c0_g1_i1.p1  ORF type:complete len:266 (-),score=57.34 TRINITY_DN5101_c0_g1_i1:182-979(-)